MKKMRNVFIGIILMIIMVCLTGCEEDSDELKKEKALSEVEYIDKKIISIVENYLTEDYVKDEEYDWNEINDDFEEVANSASVIIVDLTSLEIENDKIMEFENRVNAVNSAILNELEVNFLESIKNLYSLIPNYIEEICPENETLYLEKSTNLYLMESTYYCLIGDFETAMTYMEQAENIYKNLLTDTEYMADKSYISNKIYVAIQEMKLAIQNNETENVISKYVNTN